MLFLLGSFFLCLRSWLQELIISDRQFGFYMQFHVYSPLEMFELTIFHFEYGKS